MDLFPDPLQPGSLPSFDKSHRSNLEKVRSASEIDENPTPTARKPRSRRWMILVPAVIIGAGLLGLLVSTMFLPTLRSSLLSPFSTASKRPDLILHKVRSEYLQVSVVERGTLESADNREVVCKVKAGSRGLYSSTIRWVIDDGTLVAKGQLLMELDDSALQDQYRAQSIIVEKAKSEWVNAKEDLIITLKTNQADIANAESLAKLSELDLDKFIGLRLERDADARGAVLGAIGMLVEQGEFRQKFDDVSSRLKLAESDLEAYRDRSAWARRAVGLKYITPSQAKVEESKYDGAKDNVAKLSMEKNILTNFMRTREMTDLQNKLEVARIGLDKSERQANAKRVQSEATERTKYSVYLQELDKLNDVEKQITLCRLYSPQDGMAVYYKDPGGRWGSSNEGMIQQGAQVKEGQKLLRIPDLRKMQVNTRVHEAMVSRIRADDRPSTGYFETLRTGMLVSPNAWNRLVMNSELVLDHLRDANRDKEYTLASQGQKAKIRIDAYPDRTFDGHVRTVAAVASQSDWMSSDVKVYQTLVIIDESVEGLKPDMSAEVTIQVDPPKEPVLCAPIQSIVGGAEAGPKRRVYVMTATGPEERIVELGLFNDKMVEVRSGLLEDDQVILNPKVLLGDKAKTRDETEAPKTRGGPGGAPGGAGKGAGGGGKKKA